MKQKKMIITGAIFLILLIYVLVTHTGNRGFNTLTLPAFPKLTAEQMEQITVNRPEEKVVLEKQGGGWQLKEPFAFTADKSKLDSVTRLLENIRITNLVTERAEALADYGLNSTTAIGLVVAGGGKKVDLTVGQANDSGTHTYVQLPGDQKIYQVLGDFTQQLQRPAREWRSLGIYDFSTDDVKSVAIAQKGKRELAFSREQEAQEGIVKDTPQSVTPAALPVKMVWKEKQKGVVLNDPKVNQWLNNFTRLTAQKINDEAVWRGAPLAQIRVETTPGKIQALEVLKWMPEEQRYQVRRAGEELVYEIGRYQGESLLKGLEELK
ncbi:DUF4340 domain-containing protein [candidate division FCPU426 bacterium]|nr:DUF4340 domain-containing protein [candidate division FCPU426 bacterium]